MRSYELVLQERLLLFSILQVNVSISNGGVSSNISFPDCLNLGVCRFDLQTQLKAAGVEMCYHFQTGLVGEHNKL